MVHSITGRKFDTNIMENADLVADQIGYQKISAKANMKYDVFQLMVPMIVGDNLWWPFVE